MLLPIYRKGTYGYWASSVGLYIYDWLAGVQRSERRKMLNKEEALQLEPLLNPDGLKGAGYYYEYRTDDARLTIDIMKTAFQHGAAIVNYAKMTEFLYKDNRVVGVKVVDRITDEVYSIYAKQIVNASGPWVDSVRQLDGSLSGKRLFLTKGVHLVVAKERLPIRQSAYFDTPDGRMIFVIPQGPWCRRPCKKDFVPGLALKFDGGAQIFYILIALSDFVGAECRLAVRAIRADAVSLVQKLFFVDFGQNVPYALDIWIR